MENFEKFVLALNGNKKININFKITPTSALISRECIPIDYLRYKKNNGTEEGHIYRVWDCQGANMTALSLKDYEVKSIELLNKKVSVAHLKKYKHLDAKFICLIAIVLELIILVVLILYLYKGV